MVRAVHLKTRLLLSWIIVSLMESVSLWQAVTAKEGLMQMGPTRLVSKKNNPLFSMHFQQQLCFPHFRIVTIVTFPLLSEV